MIEHDLSGRVAAITGASSGIGEATALALAAATVSRERHNSISELLIRPSRQQL